MVCEGYKGKGENRDEIDFGETTLFGGGRAGREFYLFQKGPKRLSTKKRHEYQIDSFYNCILGSDLISQQGRIVVDKNLGVKNTLLFALS